MNRVLRVAHNTDTTAVIYESSTGALTLEYADTPYPVPVSLNLPLGHQHSGASVESWLASIVPDSERLARYWASVSGARSSRPFDLLSTKLGWDAPGLFQFVSTELEDAFAGRASAPVQPVTGSEAGRWLKQIIAACEDGAPVVSSRVGAFSLAGARAKIGLRCEPARQWQTTDGELPTSHILKAGHPRIPSHAAIEHLCMTAASLCGLRVSNTSFHDLNGTEAVLVERWDRADHDGYRTTRVWAEDFCQAAGLAPGEKYAAQFAQSPAQAARLLRHHSPDPDLTVTDFFTQLAFNYAIIGSDAHLKNYALIGPPEQLRMAPLYDSCTALGWATSVESECEFPMVIGPDRWIGTSDNTSAWRTLASDCGLVEEQGPSILKHIAERLPDAITEARSRLPAVVAERSEVRLAVERCARRGRWLREAITL